MEDGEAKAFMKGEEGEVEVKHYKASVAVPIPSVEIYSFPGVLVLL